MWKRVRKHLHFNLLWKPRWVFVCFYSSCFCSLVLLGFVASDLRSVNENLCSVIIQQITLNDLSGWDQVTEVRRLSSASGRDQLQENIWVHFHAFVPSNWGEIQGTFARFLSVWELSFKQHCMLRKSQLTLTASWPPKSAVLVDHTSVHTTQSQKRCYTFRSSSSWCWFW